MKIKKVILSILFTVFIVNMFNISVQAQEEQNIIRLETPAVYQNIANDSTQLSGWAISLNGVKDVNFFLDGTYCGRTSTFYYRDDIAKAFPTYANSKNSGFVYNLDLSKVKSGLHQITSQVESVDGTITNYTAPITVRKKASKIYMESPTTNTGVNGIELNVSGWALEDSNIKCINFYVDGQYFKSTSTLYNRPDILKAFSDYTSAQYSGFSTNIDISTVRAGRHEITAQVQGNDGTLTNATNVIYLTRKAPNVTIESPAANESISSNNIDLSGWAVNDSGVKCINFYADNNYIGNTTPMYYRADIAKAYSSYSGVSKSGYLFSIDKNLVSSGSHNFTAEVVGYDGSTAKYSRTIKVIKKSPIIVIDTPVQNQTNRSVTIGLEGWALLDSGIKEIDINIDGKYAGTAVKGYPRDDVYSYYSDYRDGKYVGYKLDVDMSKTIPGYHLLTVIAFGNDGETAYKTIGIYASGIVINNNLSYTLDQMTNIQMNLSDKPVYDDVATSTWKPATSDMVRYYLDNKNFLDDEYGKYQYLKLQYQSGISAADLNNILANKNILSNTGQIFLDAACANNISPIYLVSHALLETGNGTSKLANGVMYNGKVVYNMFGIGAYDSDPVNLGAKTAYENGWFTVEDAIRGGAKFVSSYYINNDKYKQDTLYKMRWNPSAPGVHQYATDIKWAYNQVYNIKKLLDLCKNAVLIFDIPIYK